jgi:PAS domain S-box-containing protein
MNTNLILNVDDNEAIRYARSRLLNQAGFATREASTGQQALDLIAAEHPALVLLDVNLPDMTGFEVCRRIKADPQTAHIPVLHISAHYRDDEAKVAGLDSGAQAYLTDPVDPAVLIAVAKSLLHARLQFQHLEVEVERRRHSEAALRESETKYRRIVENATDGLWIFNSEGITTFVNRRMSAMLGYRDDEMQDRSILDFVFEEDRPATLDLLERRRRGIGELSEARLRHRDGSIVWTRIAASPLQEDGQYLGVLCLVTDITERKRADEALLANEQLLRRLVDSNIIGVVTADAERILDANGIFLDMLGFSRQELRDGLLGWSAITPLEHGELDFLSRGAAEPVETEFLRKDGSRVPVLLGATPLDSQSRWLCFVLDLTVRHKAEAALRAAQKFESLGFLAGGVAHNLNNLLVGILGNVSLALESPDLPADLAALLDDAVAASERAAALTAQLLAYAGKGIGMPHAVNLSALVEDMGAILRSMLPANIVLRCDLAPDLPPAVLDQDQIRQIVSALVINAAEAIGDARGRIHVATRSVDFEHDPLPAGCAVGEPLPARYVALRVSDTGCGIPDAIRSRIFDPFFTTKFTGRGLGLAALAGIVRRYSGVIALETSPGRGSTFEVYFPVEAPTPAPPPVERPAPAQHVILVVDDDPLVRGVARTALERVGLTVLTAENGRVGIDLFRAAHDKIALVLLGLDEYEALHPDAPTLISSGYGEAEILRRLGNRRVAGILPKPYTAAALIAAVRNILDPPPSQPDGPA